jgi:RNA polymerase sigma-70 factor (ECF subfamily)
MTQKQLCADIDEYRVMVYRLAFACMGNHYDADDIAQDTFMRLYQYSKPFASDEHKKAFLIRVTTNLCKDVQKSAWFRKRSELDENIAASKIDDINDEEDALRKCILDLKSKYRSVIFLHYYEGYSTAQIAKIMRISESTITTRLSRARSQLKTRLTIS